MKSIFFCISLAPPPLYPTPPRPLFRDKQDYSNREVGYMMESYTPMTSANTTPATTPGSTPPSGADAQQYRTTNGSGMSPGVVRKSAAVDD